MGESPLVTEKKFARHDEIRLLVTYTDKLSCSQRRSRPLRQEPLISSKLSEISPANEQAIAALVRGNHSTSDPVI